VILAPEASARYVSNSAQTALNPLDKLTPDCGEVLMSRFRILVADDHPIFRFGLGSMLRSHQGWEVCGEAADGRDAVEKCRQLKPDLLIWDMSLPELNGLDAARQILKHNPDQVILVLTAVDSEQVIRECLEVGIRG